jgi:hypothetical protein
MHPKLEAKQRSRFIGTTTHNPATRSEAKIPVYRERNPHLIQIFVVSLHAIIVSKMKGFKEVILLFSLVVIYGLIHAEETNPPSVIPWYTQGMLESPFSFDPKIVDTTHTAFQLYDFFSPGNPFVAAKGNVGHSSRLLNFQPDLNKSFSLYFIDPYQHYRFQHNNIRFYRPEHVFTDLFYVTGASREQLFYGLHSQRFHEKLYVSGKYRIINSPGEYSRMAARNSNVYLSFDYQDAGDRYQLLGSFISNRIETHESGGLINHFAFEENPVRDSVFMYRSVSKYRETAIQINHFYRTGFYTSDNIDLENMPESNDEQTNDVPPSPSDEYAEKRFVNLGRINHHFAFQRRSFVFDEGVPPANFYPGTALESSFTYDSTFIYTIDNQISWSNYPVSQGNTYFPFNFKLSLTHRMVDIQQPIYGLESDSDDESNKYPLSKRSFNQFVPAISIESDKSRFLSFEGYTRMTVGGYNDEDLDIGGSIFLGRADQDSRFQASILLAQKEAPYFSSHFSSNYVRWTNDFEKMQIVQLSSSFRHKIFSAYANYYLFRNAVFMNSQAIPEQNHDAFSVIVAGLSAQLGVGAFQSRHNICYQHIGSKRFDRFAPLIGYHSIYADLSLFDKAMYLQIGFDVLYNSPYKPMAYMPVIMQFYSQDVYESDFDLFLDAFITAKIKRTRFFLKLQNIMGIIANSSPAYPVPFYPLPEAAFKFGLSWMFFD